MPENHFDGAVAATYDEFEADMFEPVAVDPVVEFLLRVAGAGAGADAGAASDGGSDAETASDGGSDAETGIDGGSDADDRRPHGTARPRALELGVGTGRIALPLSRRDVEVCGIELSPAMADQIRAKPGGERISVTIGDFATAKVEGTFRVAYLVFNTIMNLTTQAEQARCFANVAEHLEPGGHFVVEVMVPELQRLNPGETLRLYAASPTSLDFDEYDVAAQGLVSHHYRTLDGQLIDYSVPFRYVWPAELDLMAQLAGMSLRERWGGWRGEPFTNNSASHVSVWTKHAPAAGN